MPDLASLRSEFNRVWPLLWKSLCEFGPTHNKEQVWRHLVTQTAFLWTSKNSAVLGEIINHPIGLRSFNYWLQGGNLKELEKLHPIIEEWARERGCHRVTGRGRDGWVRIMNGHWQKGPTSRTKWLTEPPSQIKHAIMQELK
jgi:hypothetical protein